VDSLARRDWHDLADVATVDRQHLPLLARPTRAGRRLRPIDSEANVRSPTPLSLPSGGLLPSPASSSPSPCPTSPQDGFQDPERFHEPAGRDPDQGPAAAADAGRAPLGDADLQGAPRALPVAGRPVLVPAADVAPAGLDRARRQDCTGPGCRATGRPERAPAALADAGVEAVRHSSWAGGRLSGAAADSGPTSFSRQAVVAKHGDGGTVYVRLAQILRSKPIGADLTPSSACLFRTFSAECSPSCVLDVAAIQPLLSAADRGRQLYTSLHLGHGLALPDTQVLQDSLDSRLDRRSLALVHSRLDN